MKALVYGYTFSPSTKTITFTDGNAPTVLEQILLITNVTANQIIYNFADSTAGGILSGSSLTLTYNTTSMSSGDHLQIFVDTTVTLPVSAASLPLPTGAATSANQSTEISSLSTIASNTSGVATAANQTTGNSSLSSIVTNTSHIPVNGQAVSASSLPVVIASDQSDVNINVDQLADVSLPAGSNLPVLSNIAHVASRPTTQSLTSATTVQFGVKSGATYAVTLTSAPTATSVFSATVGFQTSPDGTNWSNVNAVPITIIGAGSVNVTSATAPGLWKVTIPTNHQYFRFNCTAYTSGTIWCHLDPWTVGQVIQLPWSYTVTTDNTLMSWIDASQISEIMIRMSAITTTVYTLQGTNDPGASDLVGLEVQEIGTVTSNGATTISAAGSFKSIMQGFKWVRLQCTTTGTVATVQGLTARLGTPLSLAAYGNSINASITGGSLAANQSTNIAQINGATPVTSGVAGLLAVGGNIAAGIAATANPVPLGAVDSDNLTRRILSDLYGRPIVNVNQSPLGGLDTSSETELLTQILLQLQVTNIYLKELPSMLITSTPFSDEPSGIIADPNLNKL